VPAGTVLTAAQLTALSNNLLYVNIHSVNFGGGEIRSQLYYPQEPRLPKRRSQESRGKRMLASANFHAVFLVTAFPLFHRLKWPGQWQAAYYSLSQKIERSLLFMIASNMR